jgi:hypothetical protein
MVSTAARQAALTVAILSSAQAARMNSGVTDDRVGFAARSTAGSGQVAYVFYDRIDVLAEVNGWHHARILAIAMAHEVGHLLLPYDVHSVDGVMRADWTNADMQLAQRNLLFFTPEEGHLLRGRISILRDVIGTERTPAARCWNRSSMR